MTLIDLRPIFYLRMDDIIPDFVIEIFGFGFSWFNAHSLRRIEIILFGKCIVIK